ncbi:MAG: hypothetical protein LBJ41_03525 [Treponema sp.]|jgi:hypothetical protein|nr:hypothetical protein [Treponema sp.]
MQRIKMKYFLELVKKEIIEVAYSWKNMGLEAIMILAFLYISKSSDKLLYNKNNMYYILTLMVGVSISSQFLMDSIFSDRRNQTLKINYVLRKSLIVMLSKNVIMMVYRFYTFWNILYVFFDEWILYSI